MQTWLKMLLGLVVLPLGLFALIRMIVKKRRARKKKLRSLAKARRARKSGKMKVVYRKSATVKTGKKLSGAQKAAFLARMNAGKRKKKKAS